MRGCRVPDHLGSMSTSRYLMFGMHIGPRTGLLYYQSVYSSGYQMLPNAVTACFMRPVLQRSTARLWSSKFGSSFHREHLLEPLQLRLSLFVLEFDLFPAWLRSLRQGTSWCLRLIWHASLFVGFASLLSRIGRDHPM
jgi:hypothetical protein